MLMTTTIIIITITITLIPPNPTIVTHVAGHVSFLRAAIAKRAQPSSTVVSFDVDFD
jgi:hypothetical protein